MEPSIFRVKFWVDLVRDFGPMIIISDLLQFSLRPGFYFRDAICQG